MAGWLVRTDSISSRPNVCGRPAILRYSGRWFSVSRHMSWNTLCLSAEGSTTILGATYSIGVQSSGSNCDLSILDGDFANSGTLWTSLLLGLVRW